MNYKEVRMFYQSTRGCGEKILSAEAIAKGLSEDGGLYVPETFPAISESVIKSLAAKSYKDRAAYVMGQYLTDFTADELQDYTSRAYTAHDADEQDNNKRDAEADDSQLSSAGAQVEQSGGVWGHPSIAPLHKIDDSTRFLELWHGPTCAFKDVALQMLPMLLTASLRKLDETREVCVLVATSGDTGKAALEGFRDIPGTKIMVFYPHDGVSGVQELQMTSQSGNNVNVVAVQGNFDDAQTGVKAIFSDEALRERLSDIYITDRQSGNCPGFSNQHATQIDKNVPKGIILSSANSINWGRLVPQIAYYISAYCDLLTDGAIAYGDKINFCVPTGNFGNILAAYYALRMGLPINKLICASNRNDVLTQFLNTGVYDKNRPFYTTASPSMDILVSSNLERLLYELSGRDSGMVTGYMAGLAANGRYEIPASVRDEAGRVFTGGRCSEEETMKVIAETFNAHNYLIDTHTAVAYKVLLDYMKDTGDSRPSVVVSTASPYKFCSSVLNALGKPQTADGVELIDMLSEATATPVPAPLAALRTARPRFKKVVPVSGMKASVLEFLGR